MYADIIVDISHEKVDRKFQYKIPSHLSDIITIGSKVMIPFGRGNKEIDGFVIGISENPKYDVNKIKEISAINEQDIRVEEKLIKLAAWMREQYGGTFVAALKTVLTIKKKESVKEEHLVRLAISREEAIEKLEYMLMYKNQKARVRALAALIDNEVLSTSVLRTKHKIDSKVIKDMTSLGLIVVESKRIYRDPFDNETEDKNVSLNDEQKKAVETFVADYKRNDYKTYLIHGITGSGKTEVYIKMAEKVVSTGKQVIILIPEIALTYQTVMRFYGKFKNKLAVINSRLSLGEKFDQLDKVKAGKVDVMIGPRSALFTPFENLGLIVIDEEHESTYKSEQVPRYHAREVAIRRAQIEGASVVLGSATPSLKAYYKCMQGEYKLITLENRATVGKLPSAHIVDMRDEMAQGNRSIISDKLSELIEDRIKNKQQVMLFINRRGYAGFVSCRSCGYVAKCPHCDVSLSSHKNGKLICHYCGYERDAIKECPECGSKHIGGFKAGTQQIEELVKRQFEGVKTLRMDMDTTREKGSYENIIKAFRNHEADILIGTQMIVKGHDFPNVTLVGILAADMSLYSSDYRASERTFQLITQAAGRAGRGDNPGEVVIQTYNPEHYAIIEAAKQDYEGFYEKEINYRDIMEYPPVAHLTAILITGKKEENLQVATDYLKKFLDMLNKADEVSIIGPSTPYISKVKDVFRKTIYIKSDNYDMLVHMKNMTEEYIEMNTGFNHLHIQFDFDPMNVV
ncbi:MAG: primosomal protein N' [Suipraeoptans sp.]